MCIDFIENNNFEVKSVDKFFNDFFIDVKIVCDDFKLDLIEYVDWE